MVHPCRASADTTGNPTYKMHACENEGSTQTLCGLELTEIHRVSGYMYLCSDCFPAEDGAKPRVTKMPWTKETNNTGEHVGSRVEEHLKPKKPDK